MSESSQPPTPEDPGSCPGVSPRDFSPQSGEIMALLDGMLLADQRSWQREYQTICAIAGGDNDAFAGCVHRVAQYAALEGWATASAWQAVADRMPRGVR